MTTTAKSIANQAGLKYIISNFIEDYFHPLGRKVIDLTDSVITDTVIIPKGKSINDVIVTLGEKSHRNSFNLKKVILTALKIASYITVVIPLIMYIARLILRKTYKPQSQVKPQPKVKSQATKTSPKPEITTPEKKQSSSRDKEILVFGDIHGELDGFKENLLHANVIDKDGNFNKNFHDIVIQMGDVVDRGPKSKEAWGFLQNLQASAKPGQVIRLLGNHELMLLMNVYHFANYSDPGKLAAEIKKDILAGKVQLSYFDGLRLFTHAGLRSKIKEQLISEIKEKKHLTTVSNKDIADYMNEILKEAVKTDKFDHAIFQISRSRGGPHSIGGPLWEHGPDLLRSKNARDIPQVIAHNPPSRIDDPPIRVTDSQRLINVDAGLCDVYGGHKAFVKIGKKSQLEIHEKIEGIWKKKVLANHALAS